MMTDVIKIFFCSFSGFLIFITLYLTRNNWVNTLSFFLTFLLLPITAFIITKAISNNLALSLGMIGALSIIRFRAPVKNPLELSIYFILITIGITIAVNYKLGSIFLAAVIIIILFGKGFEIFVTKKNYMNLFKYSLSLDQGKGSNILEVESRSKIDLLANHKNLFYYSENDNIFKHKLSGMSREELQKLKENLSTNYSTNIIVRYFD
jgi:hypothetical protein